MKNLIKSTKAAQFLIKKCNESDMWSWSVTIVGIGCMIGVCLL